MQKNNKFAVFVCRRTIRLYKKRQAVSLGIIKGMEEQPRDKTPLPIKAKYPINQELLFLK